LVDVCLRRELIWTALMAPKVVPIKLNNRSIWRFEILDAEVGRDLVRDFKSS
jgi:hypothetical protein